MTLTPSALAAPPAGPTMSAARRYGDAVEVRRRDDRPHQFLWRGRLYVVHDVLAHWVEARPWWIGAGAAGTGEPTDEREVWRVEASRGRAFSAGVYDLRLDWASGAWTLAAVVD